MWTIFNLVSKIIEIIFPNNCFVCHKKDITLCKTCLNSFKKSVDTPYLYIHSLYSFKDKNVKHIIHTIKYYHRRDLIVPLVRELVKELEEDNSYKLMANGCILVPIPMPTLRKYMRGYNQAEEIAKEIAKIYKLEMRNDILIRFKNKKRQVTTKTRGERLANQRNSFAVISPVHDMNIILIDDVTTTGATLDEARKILLKNGAKSVSAVTLAH